MPKVEQIDRYEILAEIGQGGMATVYHARDPAGAEVAIKVLRREYLTDLGFRARFEREAKTIAALEHPAIVPLLTFGRHQEQLYLVMPYMPRGSLALRLRQRTLSPEAAGAVLARMASALDDAHSRGIVHRDLKPSNILFDEDDQACLADFGIALQTAAGGAGQAVIDGTPAYMSPEQCRPEAEIDGRSDVYSMGVTLFQMLTGRPPFSGDTPLAILAQHIHHPPPALHSLDPDLPAALEPVVNKALAKEPSARYQTAGALSAAFQGALTDPDAERDAASAASGETHIPQIEEPATEASPVTSPTPVSAPDPWRTLWAQAERLTDDARRWAARHFVVALALVTLLGMLFAAIAVLAIRGPAVLQSWAARVNALSLPRTVAFLPYVSAGDADENAAPPTPDPTPTPGPNLLLLYTSESVTAINVSNEHLSLSGLTFRRPATEGVSAAAFAADEWRGVAGRAVAALSPGDCLQLLRLNGPSPNPQAPPACSKLRGWLGTRRTERLFFLPGAGAEVFEVRRGDQLLARCTIAAEACRLSVSRP